VSTPDISVIVLLFSGRDDLVRCLEALERQRGAGEVEVIVPHDDSLMQPAELAKRFPKVSFLPFTGRRTPPELRARGVAVAKGPIVALVEDHCTPDEDWCARIRAVLAGPYVAIGGAVEKGFRAGQTSDSALNWAIYMVDYSRYMNPMPAGPAHSVSDTNSAYRANALAPIRDVWAEQFHENVVNDALRGRGGALWFAPDVIVREQRSLTMGAALKDRFSFGRLFASTRVAGAPLSRRLFLAAASIAAPPVLVLRVAQNMFGRGRHRGQFFRCLPQLVTVSSVWIAGEIVGYLTGRAGASLAGNAPLRGEAAV
jgi:hypothetical protein